MQLYMGGIALVTGAGSGIGRECAISFAAEGARGVALADIDLEAAEKAAEECKAAAINPSFVALPIRVDVSDAESVEQMVARTVAEYGRIDYSVNSAGLGVEQPAEVANASLDEFDRFYRVNVRGTLLCMKAVTKIMKEQEPIVVPFRHGPQDIGRGAIVNLGSCNSYVATHHITQYTTSKHAVLGMTKNAALDNAAYGIRVNAVCPAWVDGPMVDKAVAGNPALKQMMQRVVPMGRIAKAEEVANVILFLCSPRGSFVTGADWLVDGGTTFLRT